MKTKKQKFDEMAVKKIVDLYESGSNTVAYIARQMKTTPATIRDYLERHGVYKSSDNTAARTPELLPSEIIHRQLRQAQAEVVRLKKEFRKAVAKDEKKLGKLKNLFK